MQYLEMYKNISHVNIILHLSILKDYILFKLTIYKLDFDFLYLFK